MHLPRLSISVIRVENMKWKRRKKKWSEKKSRSKKETSKSHQLGERLKNNLIRLQKIPRKQLFKVNNIRKVSILQIKMREEIDTIFLGNSKAALILWRYPWINFFIENFNMKLHLYSQHEVNPETFIGFVGALFFAASLCDSNEI